MINKGKDYCNNQKVLNLLRNLSLRGVIEFVGERNVYWNTAHRITWEKPFPALIESPWIFLGYGFRWQIFDGILSFDFHSKFVQFYKLTFLNISIGIWLSPYYGDYVLSFGGTVKKSSGRVKTKRKSSYEARSI